MSPSEKERYGTTVSKSIRNASAPNLVTTERTDRRAKLELDSLDVDVDGLDDSATPDFYTGVSVLFDRSLKCFLFPRVPYKKWPEKLELGGPEEAYLGMTGAL